MKISSSWTLVVVLASTLSQECLSFVFEPIASATPSSLVSLAGSTLIPDGGKTDAAPHSRNPDKMALHFPGPHSNQPLRNRQHLPTDNDAISFPTSDIADNKRFERSKRQLGFFNPRNPPSANKFRRPNQYGDSGAFMFPSDPPTWNNDIPARPPSQAALGRPQRPQGPRRPPPPRPNDNGFVFGPEPPMWSTTRRQRVPPLTTPRPTRVTAEPPPNTRPTPASTRASCNCPSTPEFNPVCGVDRVTYSNPGKLKCANYCGNPVKMMHLGTCITTTTPRPTPPPRIPTPPPRAPTNIRNPPQWGWQP